MVPAVPPAKKRRQNTKKNPREKGSSDRQTTAGRERRKPRIACTSELRSAGFVSSPHLRRQPEPVGDEDAPGASVARQRHRRRPAGRGVVVCGTERCHRGGEAGAQQEHGRRTRAPVLNLGRHPWWTSALRTMCLSPCPYPPYICAGEGEGEGEGEGGGAVRVA